MARPKQGYFNAAGDKIPGVGDINGRFMDRSRLLFWAFNRGRQGAPKLYESHDLDIGTCVHTMAELDLKGRSQDDIDFFANTSLPDPEQLAKAQISFAAFRKWREKFHVESYAQEVSLVSEKLQVGGTLDNVARIRRGLGLLEFKTSSDVYEDHLMQMAAYGLLWEENHPNEILSEGYHLILLPKNGDKHVHREYSRAHLKPFRDRFKIYRQAYELEPICSNPKTLRGVEVEPSIAPEMPAPPVRKPQARVEAPTQRPMSMAEIMRAYGHTKVMA